MWCFKLFSFCSGLLFLSKCLYFCIHNGIGMSSSLKNAIVILMELNLFFIESIDFFDMVIWAILILQHLSIQGHSLCLHDFFSSYLQFQLKRSSIALVTFIPRYIHCGSGYMSYILFLNSFSVNFYINTYFSVGWFCFLLLC